MTLKFGKKPARPGAVKVSYADFVDHSKLQDPGNDFGHERLVRVWDILMNNKIGCCGISGGEHESMLWTAEAGKPAYFSSPSLAPDRQPTVVNYSSVTGYVPGPELYDPNAPENPTDQGIDVPELIKFRYLRGLVDTRGHRHRIAGAVSLDPGNWNQLRYAAYYFDGVGLGIRLCQEWVDNFTENGTTVWDAVPNPTWVGGHYITAVAFRGGKVIPITWGEPVFMTQAGYEMASDETFAYAATEKIGPKGVDADGLNARAMFSAMHRLRDVS